MIKGKIKYLPKEFVEEMNNTKLNFDIDDEGDCLIIMAKNNRLARELRINLNFPIKKRKR